MRFSTATLSILGSLLHGAASYDDDDATAAGKHVGAASDDREEASRPLPLSPNDLKIKYGDKGYVRKLQYQRLKRHRERWVRDEPDKLKNSPEAKKEWNKSSTDAGEKCRVDLGAMASKGGGCSKKGAICVRQSIDLSSTSGYHTGTCIDSDSYYNGYYGPFSGWEEHEDLELHEDHEDHELHQDHHDAAAFFALLPAMSEHDYAPRSASPLAANVEYVDDSSVLATFNGGVAVANRGDYEEEERRQLQPTYCESLCQGERYTVPSDKNIQGLVYKCLKDGKCPEGVPPECWITSSVTDMSHAFNGFPGHQEPKIEAFNEPLYCWDTSRVTNMHKMFYSAERFSRDVNGWDTSRVIDMSFMFHRAYDFMGDIDSWDTSSVTNMYRMFQITHSFNGDVNSWDTGRVITMTRMFAYADEFDNDVNDWDTSSVTDMDSMFYRVPLFNRDVNSWDTSRVNNMNLLFRKATSFNRDVDSWDTSRVNDMALMFSEANSFNHDVSSWDTSRVTNMSSMFWKTASFNRDVNSWDTSGVTNFGHMFDRAKSFNHCLSSWRKSYEPSPANMFADTQCPVGDKWCCNKCEIKKWKNGCNGSKGCSWRKKEGSWQCDTALGNGKCKKKKPQRKCERHGCIWKENKCVARTWD